MDDNQIRSVIDEGIIESNGSTSDKELGKLAVELWKIEKKIQKCKEKLSEEENKSFEFLFTRVNQILGNGNVKVTDFVNQKWNEGMALLDIISVEEVDGLEFPVIGETVSPLVEVNGKIIQRSKVVIYKPKVEEGVEIIELLSNKKKLWLYLSLLIILIIVLLGLSFFFKGSKNKNIENIDNKEQIDSVLNNSENVNVGKSINSLYNDFHEMNISDMYTSVENIINESQIEENVSSDNLNEEGNVNEEIANNSLSTEKGIANNIISSEEEIISSESISEIEN